MIAGPSVLAVKRDDVAQARAPQAHRVEDRFDQDQRLTRFRGNGVEDAAPLAAQINVLSVVRRSSDGRKGRRRCRRCRRSARPRGRKRFRCRECSGSRSLAVARSTRPTSAARCASSHCNSQPKKFRVLPDHPAVAISGNRFPRGLCAASSRKSRRRERATSHASLHRRLISFLQPSALARRSSSRVARRDRCAEFQSRFAFGQIFFPRHELDHVPGRAAAHATKKSFALRHAKRWRRVLMERTQANVIVALAL